MSIQKTPYGYYNERVEKRDGKLFFKTETHILEENFINEEQVGAYAEDDLGFTPLFFNARSTYRGQETLIDGNVVDGKQFTAKTRIGSTESPLVRLNLPPGAIFSQFFPLWLARQVSSLKGSATKSFLALLETSKDTQFRPVHGRIKLDTPDDFATLSKTTKVSVTFNDQVTHWWLDSNGTMVKITKPDNGMVTEISTREKAEQFLSPKANLGE